MDGTPNQKDQYLKESLNNCHFEHSEKSMLLITKNFHCVRNDKSELFRGSKLQTLSILTPHIQSNNPKLAYHLYSGPSIAKYLF